jgi:hypothetical protein
MMEDDSKSGNWSELLADMMSTEASSRGLWSAGDFGAILEHQLSVPMEPDLKTVDAALARRLCAQAAALSPPIRCLRDLFHHPRPPIELLALSRQFAKRCRSRSEGELPDEVATVLYFLSIVVAALKHGRRISGLDDQALLDGIDWALRQAWLDVATREIFGEGRAAVAKRS